MESAQRRKITTLKRDEKIPSFNQVDGLLSSPTAETKAEVEMEEVEKKEKEEEKKKKVEGEKEKKKKEMMQPGSAGSSLLACIIDPTTSTSGEVEASNTPVSFPLVQAVGSQPAEKAGQDQGDTALVPPLVPLVHLLSCGHASEHKHEVRVSWSTTACQISLQILDQRR